MVGFSQGAATTVALLSKWDKPEPIQSMVAYDGWMPTDHAKWADNVKVQQTIPFLQMAGSNDANFCPLSHFSYNNNLKPEIYTGEFEKNLKFLELSGE